MFREWGTLHLGHPLQPGTVHKQCRNAENSKVIKSSTCLSVNVNEIHLFEHFDIAGTTGMCFLDLSFDLKVE